MIMENDVKSIKNFALNRLNDELKQYELGADNMHDIQYWRAFIDGVEAVLRLSNEN